MDKISVVINTLNEEENIAGAIDSAKKLSDDIVVVDMKSDDSTQALAEKKGARVYEFKRVGYVEPARNYATSKVLNDWIFILDADERLTNALVKKIKQIIKKPKADYYRVPRKNIIFGAWIKHSRWWPDFNIRLFKKGSVSWSEVIHSVPRTQGKGLDLPEKEELAIVHNHYQTIEQYLERMNRYTSIQAKMLIESNYKFIWKDLVRRPASEFISRYFAGEGYKDGLHGLTLSLLQAFSEAILYLKVWQEEKFLAQTISIDEIVKETKEIEKELDWWLLTSLINAKRAISSLPLRIQKKLLERK
jgi:(heptosyl)LPS beta-1,4-glucosyltransferase